jgi:glycosyltransferase involved in cell wall biosynthesis
VIYVHEPVPGVSNVRNAALQAASGALLAFLDDDEAAEPLWLSELLRVSEAFDADLVFGPKRGRAPADCPHRAFLEAFFTRSGPDGDQIISTPYGCGNSLLRRAALNGELRPFDPRFNATGGEDDFLYAALIRRGSRIAWAARAGVFEDPPEGRLTLRYALRRGFAFGQGPTVQAAMAGERGRALVFMGKGALQVLAYGPLALGLRLFGSDRWPFAALKMVKGLGKVFWWRALHEAFYAKLPQGPLRGAPSAEAFPPGPVALEDPSS